MLYLKTIDKKRKDGYKEYTHNEGISLLALGLSNEYHKPLSDFTILAGEKGKPYFDNSDIHFSISHTNGLCAVLISDNICGVDAEIIREAPYGVIKRCFKAEEKTALENSKSKNLDFTILWTLKECRSKITGEGLSIGFNNFGFDLKKSRTLFDSDFDFDVYIVNDEFVVTASKKGNGAILVSELSFDDISVIK